MKWFSKISPKRKNEVFGFMLFVLAMFFLLSLATHTAAILLNQLPPPPKDSKVPGRVIRVLAENGQPVEYGQPLFLIEP